MVDKNINNFSLCPYCNSEILNNQNIIICPSCKIPHHAECWQVNNGCTTFGCKSSKAKKSEMSDTALQGITFQLGAERCKDYIDVREIPVYEQLLTMLKRSKGPIDWLDIACGRGNLLKWLTNELPEHYTRRIRYLGFDSEETYIKECWNVIIDNKLQKTLRKVEAVPLNICRMQDIKGTKFNLITCLNVLHEINPLDIPDLITNILRLSKPQGTVLFQDMEKLPLTEIGAITWTCEEIKKILSVFICEKKLHAVTRFRKVPTYRISFDRKDVLRKLDFRSNFTRSTLRKNLLSKVLCCLESKRINLSQDINLFEKKWSCSAGDSLSVPTDDIIQVFSLLSMYKHCTEKIN